jgi:hypothetical protein
MREVSAQTVVERIETVLRRWRDDGGLVPSGGPATRPITS